MGGTKVRAAFVGRASELDRLDDALSRSIQGDGIAVLVGGEAGIGKTRLVTEFSKRAFAGGAIVLTGECVESGAAGLPYGPIAQALHGAFSSGLLDPTALPTAVVEQLAILMPAIGRVEPGGTAPFDVAGLGQVRLFEAILATVEHLSAERVLVLVIEDVHWADRSTLDLLTYLVRNVDAMNCLIVATVRTEDVGRGGPVAGTLAELHRRPAVERMDLHPLDPGETAAYLRAILGDDLDDRLAARIHRRSDGNPFFVEQLAWAYRDGDAAAMPPSLRDLLLTQLSREPPDVQSLLAAAAVAGSQVDEPLLSAVLGRSGEEVVIALHQAIRSHLLVPIRDQAGETYPFRHALMAEAVEADLLDGERRRLRARCAEALMHRPPGQGVGRAQWAAMIAHHLDHAGDAAGTAAASLVAAVEAEAIAAHNDALAQYRRAIRIIQASPGSAAPSGWDRAEIHRRAAACAAVAGDADEAARQSGLALEQLPLDADPIRRGSMLIKHAEHLWLAGDDGFLAALTLAAAVIPAEPPTQERADALVMLGFHHKYVGAGEDARACWEEAADTSSRAGARRAQALAMNCLAELCLETGEVEEAERLLHDGLEMLRIAEPSPDKSVVYMDMAAVAGWAGDDERSVAIAREGIADAQRHGFASFYGGGLVSNGADALWSLGRFREAAAFLDDIDVGRPGSFAATGQRMVRAVVSMALGNTDEARATVADSAEWLEHGDQTMSRYLRMVQAEALVEDGRPEHVEAIVAAGIALRAGHSPWEDQRAALGWLAVRAAADLAVVARARRDSAAEERACRSGAVALATLDAMLTRPRSERAPDRRRARAYASLAAAEATRLAGRAEPLAWRKADEAWHGLNYVIRPMYARVREAEAWLESGRPGRTQAATLLKAVLRDAVACDAGRLISMIDGLARRGRVELHPAAPIVIPDRAVAAAAVVDVTGRAGRPYGLTDREVEILGLLAAGLTNRQIGERLYISPKTAGVHVSNILGKLGVGSRIQAATMAHHMGLETIEIATAT